jgi:hypothetical protein
MLQSPARAEQSVVHGSPASTVAAGNVTTGDEQPRIALPLSLTPQKKTVALLAADQNSVETVVKHNGKLSGTAARIWPPKEPSHPTRIFIPCRDGTVCVVIWQKMDFLVSVGDTLQIDVKSVPTKYDSKYLPTEYHLKVQGLEMRAGSVAKLVQDAPLILRAVHLRMLPKNTIVTLTITIESIDAATATMVLGDQTGNIELRLAPDQFGALAPHCTPGTTIRITNAVIQSSDIGQGVVNHLEAVTEAPNTDVTVLKRAAPDVEGLDAKKTKGTDADGQGN